MYCLYYETVFYVKAVSPFWIWIDKPVITPYLRFSNFIVSKKLWYWITAISGILVEYVMVSAKFRMIDSVTETHSSSRLLNVICEKKSLTFKGSSLT